MKAAIFLAPGLVELAPRAATPPEPGEAVLAVKRVGICGSDVMIFRGGMSHRVQPGRILGHEMVAEIAEIQPGAGFRCGDRVVVEPTVFCGSCPACQRGRTHVCQQLKFLGIDADGALQERWKVPVHRLHKVPDHLSDDLAALTEPLAVAVHDVRLAALQPRETVVVIGGGPIGLFLSLLVRRQGARPILLEVNSARLAFAQSFGFEVWNPRAGNAAAFIESQTDGAGADVVFEASGTADGAQLATQMAGVQGRIMMVGIQGRETPFDLFQVFYRELSVLGARAYSSADFREALRLLSSSEIDPARFISHRFPLAEIQAALEFVSSGASTMKTLIHVG